MLYICAYIFMKKINNQPLINLTKWGWKTNIGRGWKRQKFPFVSGNISVTSQEVNNCDYRSTIKMSQTFEIFYYSTWTRERARGYTSARVIREIIFLGVVEFITIIVIFWLKQAVGLDTVFWAYLCCSSHHATSGNPTKLTYVRGGCVVHVCLSVCLINDDLLLFSARPR